MHVHFIVQVPKSSTLDEHIQRLGRKIERLLAVFQPDLVRLRGRLTRNSVRAGVICSLSLNLPTGQLASEASAANAQLALHQAGDDIVEQIKKHKQRLHREQRRSGHATVRNMPAAGELAPAPVSNESERQDLSAYIAANVDQLRRFVARQLRLREQWGQLRPGQLDVREVLDEMIADALSSPNGRHPAPPRWFYLLAVQAIHRLAGQTDQQYGGEVSDSLDRELTEAEKRREEEEEYAEFSAVEQPQLSDITPDLSMGTPEEAAATEEAVTLLEAALERLPPRQREDLVLFAIEGFALDEIAMLSRRTPEQVLHDVRQANEQLARQDNIPGELRRLLVEQAGKRLREVA